MFARTDRVVPAVLFRTLVLAAVVAAPGLADAQAVPRVTRWYRGPGYGNVYGNYGYGFSSTPIEGARRGLADIIRAEGEARVATADALLTYEEARSRFFDNKLKWVEIYWARRRLNEAERQQDYDRLRARRDAWRNNRPRSVAHLNPSQLDPSTGRIEWPTPLQAAEFYAYRRKIDELFLLRAETASIPGLNQDINRTTQAMKDELKAHILDMTPNEYLEARRFVEGLNYAALDPQG